MEIALVREIMAAFPDVENYNSKKLDDLMALCDRFFRWEREHILLGDPTDQEKQEHEEVVQFLQRVTKILLVVDRNKRLENLSRRLNESWLVFHNPIQAEEAEKILTQAFPEMNPHLEALLRAYDAYSEANEQERAQREAIYNSHLDDIAERTRVSRENLHLSVKFRHREWLKAQKKPASVPKKA